ncbi:NUDIX domain-containing protein [Streptomyces anulatus]|uniref:NUDIX domain-containing protein n=1 Tax=Streptomyces anulatus TaxID=1892 RepID=UPI002E13E3EF|nr:NUDIX domain-containing protein [Streptomyces anulatus]
MGTYETDLAAAKRSRTAWGCTCGADNPAAYDACHDCGRPSWTCAACGTVNTTGRSDCDECGNSMPAELLGDRSEGFEMTYEEWIATQVGPRVVGGRYRHSDAGGTYEVLAIERGPRPPGVWPVWDITVRFERDSRENTHCTGWDARRDTVVAQPPADDKSTWRYTADVVAVDPDGRVLLIERRWEPFAGCWALPGGHLDAGEDPQDAAARELTEETGVLVPAADLVPIGTYDAPGRDPRGRYSTDAYLARVPADTLAVADDDAANVRWVKLSTALEDGALAFDHADILRDARRVLTGGEPSC